MKFLKAVLLTKKVSFYYWKVQFEFGSSSVRARFKFDDKSLISSSLRKTKSSVRLRFANQKVRLDKSKNSRFGRSLQKYQFSKRPVIQKISYSKDQFSIRPVVQKTSFQKTSCLSVKALLACSDNVYLFLVSRKILAHHQLLTHQG